MGEYVIALDQGTTSSRAVLIDRLGRIKGMSQSPFPQLFPQPGWVEHSPKDILSSQLKVLAELLVSTGVSASQIDSIGITNQRETTVVWDRVTGEPIHNAIVWQCRRTTEIVERCCSDAETAAEVTHRTGLIPDAYYSASKIAWILDAVPGARERAEAGELAFGTVDSWLIWNLTQGEVHATDPTNASRTMLFNINTGQWDEWLCRLFNVPEAMLPEVRPSSGDFGMMHHPVIAGAIPIRGVAGDQQAALFGQTCFDKGMAKNTYGTGCFLLMNTGTDIFQSKNGLVTTMAASADGTARYALEGSVFIGGAVIQWIRDELHLIHEAADSEYFATRLEDNGGVYVVPAFTGLGAPYWDMYARGAIMGLTRGCNRKHIIRAALESIAYQSRDVLVAMERDTDIRLQELRVDGGASANNFLMQFQSDIIHTTIRRPMIRETTALGAAYLAGLATGVWNDLDEIREQWTLDKLYTPQMSEEIRERNLRGWDKAIGRVQHWEDR